MFCETKNRCFVEIQITHPAVSAALMSMLGTFSSSSTISLWPCFSAIIRAVCLLRARPCGAAHACVRMCACAHTWHAVSDADAFSGQKKVVASRCMELHMTPHAAELGGYRNAVGDADTFSSYYYKRYILVTQAFHNAVCYIPRPAAPVERTCHGRKRPASPPSPRDKKSTHVPHHSTH